MDLIKVELKDGAICRMAPSALNYFLEQHMIRGFQRSEGWVRVGQDSLRQPRQGLIYRGTERRDPEMSYFRVCGS